MSSPGFKAGSHMAQTGFDLHIAEDDLEFIIFLFLPGLQTYYHTLFICHAGHPPFCMHAKRVLYSI